MSALAKRDHVPEMLMVEQARGMLAQARRVDEAKRIRDQGQAVKVYLRATKAAKAAIDDAGEIVLFATRRMGELLKEQKRTGKRQRQGGNRRSKSHAARMNETPTLEDMGLTASQASRAQALADIPEATVQRYVEERRADAARSITVSGLVASKDDEPEETPTVDVSAPDPLADIKAEYLALTYGNRALFREWLASGEMAA